MLYYLMIFANVSTAIIKNTLEGLIDKKRDEMTK